jgi:hypothetical protein
MTRANKVLKNEKKIILIGAILGLVLVTTFIACTNPSDDGSTSSSTGATVSAGATSDLNGIGVIPESSWHDHYLESSHSDYSCADCHTTATRTKAEVARAGDVSNSARTAEDQICNLCHNDDYVNSIFNHGALNIDTYCNSCHYSDSWTTSRVATEKWHDAVQSFCDTCHPKPTTSFHINSDLSACADCHQYPTWDAELGDHSYIAGCSNCHTDKDHNLGASCENCHTYPNWDDVSGGHSFTSGCDSCHSKHKSNCQNCHTYPDWDDHGDDDKGDDDKGDDDKGDDDKGDDDKGDDD